MAERPPPHGGLVEDLLADLAALESALSSLVPRSVPPDLVTTTQPRTSPRPGAPPPGGFAALDQAIDGSLDGRDPVIVAAVEEARALVAARVSGSGGPPPPLPPGQSSRPLPASAPTFALGEDDDGTAVAWPELDDSPFWRDDPIPAEPADGRARAIPLGLGLWWLATFVAVTTAVLLMR